MSKFQYFGFGVPWEEAANYSQAVKAGNLLFVSGQLSHAEDGTFVGEGDFERQLETTFVNLDKVLANFGADKTDIAEVNVFIVNLRENFEATGDGLSRYFGAHRPANNALGVAALAFPEQLIEVAATVVLTAGERVNAA